MQAVPSEFLEINRKERVNKPFFDLDLRASEVRTHDFEDVVIEFTPERAMVQAACCIHCPDPALCMIAQVETPGGRNCFPVLLGAPKCWDKRRVWTAVPWANTRAGNCRPIGLAL